MKNHNQDQPNSSDGRPRRLPTLEIVAELAGVSRATVSRVVNRSPKVSPEVVAAVNKANQRARLRTEPCGPGPW